MFSKDIRKDEFLNQLATDSSFFFFFSSSSWEHLILNFYLPRRTVFQGVGEGFLWKLSEVRSGVFQSPLESQRFKPWPATFLELRLLLRRIAQAPSYPFLKHKEDTYNHEMCFHQNSVWILAWLKGDFNTKLLRHFIRCSETELWTSTRTLCLKKWDVSKLPAGMGYQAPAE